MPRPVVRLRVLQNTQIDDARPLRLPGKGKRIRSLQLKRMGKTDRLVNQLLHPEAVNWRPKTRADCSSVPRPCPYVSCRHHLYLEVSDRMNLRIVFDGEPWEMAESCSLDVVDREPDGIILDDVGDILGVTKERVRQVQVRALRKAELRNPGLAQLWGCAFLREAPRLSRGTKRTND